MNISEKIFSLRKKLHDHNYRYYVLDDPLISDYEYAPTNFICAWAGYIRGTHLG